MTQSSFTLLRVQAWMQSILMHQGGIAHAIGAAGQHLPLDLADLASVIAPSEKLSSLERLEIYARAYYVRLVECLRDEFPILAKAIGEETFDQFALDYLERNPSYSYTLSELGSRFANFLAETRPPSEQPGSADWCDFFVDLARLEWTFQEVFDGPGIEGQPPLDGAELAKVPPEQWPIVRLIPAPCLRLLQFRFPVARYYQSLRNGTEEFIPVPESTFLIITRRDFVCRHYEVNSTQFELLSALVSGQTIGEAVASLLTRSQSHGTDPSDQSIHAWFRDWAREGLFIKAFLPDFPPAFSAIQQSL